MANGRPDWQCSFTLPWDERIRMQALAMINWHLRIVSSNSPIQLTMEGDPDTPVRIWVGARGPITNEITMKIQEDIQELLNNFIIKPRSVWEWLRTNPYK